MQRLAAKQKLEAATKGWIETHRAVAFAAGFRCGQESVLSKYGKRGPRHIIGLGARRGGERGQVRVWGGIRIDRARGYGDRIMETVTDIVGFESPPTAEFKNSSGIPMSVRLMDGTMFDIPAGASAKFVTALSGRSVGFVSGEIIADQLEIGQ